MPKQPLPTFTMPFEPMTIEHLGLRLYSTLPPVIAELVTNAYDAESPKVEIVVPEQDIAAATEVIVRDYGHGMTAQELQNEYLPIGRNRRGEDSQNVMSKNGKVRVTGRKGLGKLSSFGIADELEIRSVHSGTAVTLLLSYSSMMSWAKQHGDKPYEPVVVAERTGPTEDPDGVEVTIRKLHRTNRISVDSLRKGLARRLTMIGPKFEVLVNGTGIQPGDRTTRGQCAKVWDVSELPHGAHPSEDYEVSGWIGFLATSSQVGRGVDIFANEKAVELGSYFNFPSTHAQFARAHLVGEIHADFLDGPEGDQISTARNSVVWECSQGQALQEWGRETLRWAFEEWLAIRRKDKEETIIRAAGFDKWLEGREERERRVAQRMVKLLVDDENLDPDSARPLLEIIKGSVETVAFLDLIETIEKELPTPASLLRLFNEWRIIEAREHLRLADGRVAAIEKLEDFVEHGALEVQELQPLLVDNLWLIDYAWTEADVQPTYTKLLQDKCKEPKDLPEKDRRLDILGVTSSGGATIVELKRPEKTLSRLDLEQIERYVDWARTHIQNTGPDSPNYVHGLLIVGKLSQKAEIAQKMARLAGSDIRVETYADLHARSRRHYKEIEDRLKSIAPEYARSRRKSKETKKP